MPPTISYETFSGEDMNEDMLQQAADLFSSNYGVWGKGASEKMGKWAKAGMNINSPFHPISKLHQRRLLAFRDTFC